MGRKEIVRQGYDTCAETYAERNSTDERRVGILQEYLGALSTPARILDAGCGHGTPTLRQVNQELTVVGLDFSREQLRIAHETGFAGGLVQADMSELPFQPSVFDAVTAFDSLIHVPLADHQRVIDEFARVLRPGGSVLLSEAPEEFERTTQDWLGGGNEMTWTMAGTETTKDQLRDAGFTITKQWDAPQPASNGEPEPPFLAARLDPTGH